MKAGPIIALFGGAAAALGHAPFDLWYVAFPGFALAVHAVAGAATGVQGFRRAWLAGAAYFAITLQWIVEPFLVDAATHGWMAPFALILMAGGLALFWGAAGWVAARLADTPGRRAVIFAVALTGAEMLRGHVFTGFPWALPAYIWAETPVRAAVAYTGSYGLTLLVLLAAALPSLGLSRWLRAGLTGFALAALFALGLYRIDHADSSARSLGTVGIVGSAVAQADKWNPDLVPEHLGAFLQRTEALAEETPDLVVWPEAAVVYPLDRAGPVLEAAAGAARGTPLITGINRRADGEWYNSLVMIGPGGAVAETYDKVHLVPFGEYIPFRLSILRALAATRSNGYAAGAAVHLIDTPLGRALPLICYEGIFPGQIFKADARPEVMLLITNDGWFGTFAGPQQHFDQARFRAAEQGVPVVRAANSGISGVIDAVGGFDGEKMLNGPSAIAREVITLDAPTLYSRTGDGPLIAGLLLLLGGFAVARRRETVAKAAASS